MSLCVQPLGATSQAVQAAGIDGRLLRYIPYDAGGKAKAGLLSGEVNLLSTGLSEALDMMRAGQVRILAITADEPLVEYPQLPTMKTLGYDMEFVNWRGFFAAPDVSQAKVQEYSDRFQRLMATPEWESVRQRNGWRTLFTSQDAFVDVLEAQEQQLRDAMEALGFIHR